MQSKKFISCVRRYWDIEPTAETCQAVLLSRSWGGKVSSHYVGLKSKGLIRTRAFTKLPNSVNDFSLHDSLPWFVNSTKSLGWLCDQWIKILCPFWFVLTLVNTCKNPGRYTASKPYVINLLFIFISWRSFYDFMND